MEEADGGGVIPAPAGTTKTKTPHMYTAHVRNTSPNFEAFEHTHNVDAADLGAAAGAAAGTAAAPGIGTAIGAAFGKVLGRMFGGGTPRAWANAGPGVRDLFAAGSSTGLFKYHGQAFLDWLRANNPNAFDTVEHVIGLFPAFLFPLRSMVRPDEPEFTRIPGLIERAYQAMGVDYWATQAANQVPNAPINFVMLPGGGTPAAPTVAVNAMHEALNNAAAGVGSAVDHAIDRALGDAADKGAGAPKTAGGSGDWIGTLLLVVIGLMVARAVFK